MYGPPPEGDINGILLFPQESIFQIRTLLLGES